MDDAMLSSTVRYSSVHVRLYGRLLTKIA